MDKLATAEITAGILGRQFGEAWGALDALENELSTSSRSPEEMDNVLRQVAGHWSIRTLTEMWNSLGWVSQVDKAVEGLQVAINECTANVLFHFNGWLLETDHPSPEGTDKLEQFIIHHRGFMELMYAPAKSIRALASVGWTASEGNRPEALVDLLPPHTKQPRLRKLMTGHEMPNGRTNKPQPFKRQLWRIDDLARGGVIYSLEIFMAGLRANLQPFYDNDLIELYHATFRAIVDAVDWKTLMQGTATQKGLVELLRDTLNPTTDGDVLPLKIVEDYVAFIGDVFRNAEGQHIDEILWLLGNEENNGSAYGDHYIGTIRNAIHAITSTRISPLPVSKQG